MANSKVNEARLWSWLIKGTKSHFKRALHMSRIENSCTKSMPDVEGVLNGHQFWIELKSCKRPASPDTLLDVVFQEGQPEWAKRRIEAGGRSFILLQVGSGPDALRYLINGMFAPRMLEGMTEFETHKLSIVSPNDKAHNIIWGAAYGAH